MLLLLNQRDNPEEEYGAEGGGDELAEEAAPLDAEPVEEAAAEDTADDADHEVDPEAEAAAFHDFAGEVASQCTHEDA